MKNKEDFIRDIMGSIENRVRSAYNEGRCWGQAEAAKAAVLDTAAIEAEAYKRGYEKGREKLDHLEKTNERLKRERDEAFDALDSHNDRVDAAYKRGMEDGWNLARKIVLNESSGGMSVPTIKRIFGEAATSMLILRDCPAQEVVNLVRAYRDGLKDEINSLGGV